MSAEPEPSVASTSRSKPSILSTLQARNANLPAKPRATGDFKTQDDFISFADLEAEHSHSNDSRIGGRYNGNVKGKGRAIEGDHQLHPRGKKRPIGDVLEEQGKTRLKDTEKTTPWTAEVDWDSYPSATEQLTAEIKAFARYIQPTDQEHDLRTCVVESIRRLIVKRWPNAQLHPFGSFMTRLYLPTGDIDLVCVIPSLGGPENKGPIRNVLYQLSTMLRSSQLGKDIIVIGKARVPIIKFTSVQGGFKVDISVNMTNSIKVYPRVLQLFERVGEETARALIMITKAFLNQRQMNEVHTGGLGSYSIICLVCSFLQMHPKLQRKEMSTSDNLGTLLIEFLEVYGKNFNYDEVGICLSGKGSYYSKTRRGWQSDRRGKLTLSIEDPADPTNDVSSGSYNMNLVRQSISGAFEVLTASVYYRTSIILARLANQQSGVQLNTLSGRAIPHATGEEGRDSDIDECRKSLLGAILGVTSAVEQSRNDLRRLAELGTVQRSLGLPIKEYDEEGMLVVPGQPKKQQAKRNPNRPRFTNTNHIRFAPEPNEPPPRVPPPPAPVPAANGHRAENDAGSDMEIETPPAEAERAPPAKRQKLIDLTTPSPERQPTKKVKGKAAAQSAKTFIDLDSPSPPPEPAEAGLAQGDAKAESPETESRYSVKKGKKPSKPAKVTYVPEPVGGSSSDEGEEGQASSDDDASSVVISTDSDEPVKTQEKARPRPVMRKSGSNSAVPRSQDTNGMPRTRSRTLSQTITQRPSLTNGQRTSSNGRASTKSPKKPEATGSKDKVRGKPEKANGTTGPSKPVVSSKARRDYWQAKGSTSHQISTDDESSDDDGVYVVSQRAKPKAAS